MRLLLKKLKFCAARWCLFSPPAFSRVVWFLYFVVSAHAAPGDWAISILAHGKSSNHHSKFHTLNLRAEDVQGEKRPPSGFLCWIQSYQLRGKKTQTSQTPTIFHFNFSRFESEPSQGICPRKARKVRCGLCNGPGSLGTRRCPATAPCDTVTASPAREQPPILPKQQVLVRYLFSARLGALGWKPRPLPIGRWMELLYSTLPLGLPCPMEQSGDTTFSRGPSFVWHKCNKFYSHKVKNNKN